VDTSTLAHSLKQVKIDKNTQLCSFDVEITYKNIPIHEVKSTVKNIVEKNNNTSKEEKKEILELLNVILEQNYKQHNK
jgi:hypothetical protein